ncbi:hypothetical protein [Sphingomonas sp. XXL09]|uniref:hypothetical protein n=1 Tax=Sphingomonas sp. XXL09 TaxID=3457787 RepID=UPI00406BDB5D
MGRLLPEAGDCLHLSVGRVPAAFLLFLIHVAHVSIKDAASVATVNEPWRLVAYAVTSR